MNFYVRLEGIFLSDSLLVIIILLTCEIKGGQGGVESYGLAHIS
jgi:hypothetical protein